MRTVIPFGDPKAVKKWSGSLFIDVVKKSYFNRKFTGESDNSVIQRLTDLESGPGDTMSFDLSIKLRGRPTAGDARLEGKEEQLKFATDQIYIDQLRHAVSAGGRMTRKRSMHDLRSVGRDRLGDYWAKYTDELMFIYLSGSRGINEDFTEDTLYGGHAGNAIQAPDSAHTVYGGDATAKANVDSSDFMSRNTIERAAVKARMMSATDPTKQNMIPISINGEPHFVTVMNPYQEHSLRTGDTAGWLEIQKAAAAAEGRNNPLFMGGLGMINNVVLHSHESVIRFSDFGSGTNLPAARALFLGKQAGVVAYGSSGSGNRLTWEEEMKDYNSEPTIAAGFIVGVKKTRFNGGDFGTIAIDTYAKDPNS